MSAIAQLPATTRRSLHLLFVCALLFWSCMASMLPVLPLYIEDGGATAHEVGIVMGSFAVGLLLFRPSMGKLADRRSRKLVLLIGLVAAILAPIGYFLTEYKFFLMGIRVFHGLSIAGFTTAYSALVADLSPPENRGEIIGHMTLANPIGMALGPLMGDSLLRWQGYGLCFLVASGLASVSFLCATQVNAQTIAAPASHPSEAQSASQTAFWKILWSDRLRIPSLTMMMIGLAFGILSTFIPLYLRETQLPIAAGNFYTTGAIGSFLMRFVAGRGSDRYGRGRFITLGLGCYTMAMLILWQTHSPQGFLLAGLLEGIGGGTFIPIMLALITDRAAAAERGRVFSLCISGFDLGIFLAGPMLGGIADWIGYRGLFGVAMGFTILGLLLFVTRSSKDVAHSVGFALGGGRDVYAVREP